MLVGPSAMLALLLTHVAVEVDPNLVAASASRAAALLREERGRRGGDGRRLRRGQRDRLVSRTAEPAIRRIPLESAGRRFPLLMRLAKQEQGELPRSLQSHLDGRRLRFLTAQMRLEIGESLLDELAERHAHPPFSHGGVVCFACYFKN